jgi:hypothetical protein
MDRLSITFCLVLLLLGCSSCKGVPADNRKLQSPPTDQVLDSEGIPIHPVAESQDEIYQRILEKERRYEKKLFSAPSYTSKIRSELISNPDSYRGSYRISIDIFRGLEQEFRCIHNPAIIASAQKDGWQLVRCSEREAIFFRAHQNPLPKCEKVPTVPELYETLTIFPDEPGEGDRVLSLERLRKSLRGDAKRPTQNEVSYDHFMVVRHLDYGREIRPGIIPEIEGIYARDISFYDPEKLLVIKFFDPRNPSHCKKNSFGIRHTFGGSIHLDSPATSFSEMESKLERNIKHVSLGK